MRNRLLELHKLLLDQERAAYEGEYGPVVSAGAVLQLVLSHPQFEWLRKLSSLVVEFDEMLAPRSAAGATEAEGLLQQTRELITGGADAGDFQRKYEQAVVENESAGALHREIVALLGAPVK